MIINTKHTFFIFIIIIIIIINERRRLHNAHKCRITSTSRGERWSVGSICACAIDEDLCQLCTEYGIQIDNCVLICNEFRWILNQQRVAPIVSSSKLKIMIKWIMKQSSRCIVLIYDQRNVVIFCDEMKMWSDERERGRRKQTKKSSLLSNYDALHILWPLAMHLTRWKFSFQCKEKVIEMLFSMLQMSQLMQRSESVREGGADLESESKSA